MVSDKALYWIAVGVLALVAGNSLMTRHDDWVNCIGDESLQVAQRVTDRVMAMVRPGGTLFDGTNDRFARSEYAVARVQSRIASVQARVARKQADLARLQAEKVRTFDFTTVKRTVKCPRREVTVEVPDVQVEVSDDLN